jgi:hypothetical protein
LAAAEISATPSAAVRATTTEGFGRKAFNAILEISRRCRPKWDGKPNTWRKFWRNWEYFWALREPTLDPNPEIKKLLFIDCLPDSEIKRATALVVNNKISFDDLVEKYRVQCQHLVPSFQAEAEWRSFVPESRKWSDVDHWFHDWLQLAAEVNNLTEEAMNQQFIRVLIVHFPKIIQFIMNRVLRAFPTLCRKCGTSLHTNCKLANFVAS